MKTALLTPYYRQATRGNAVTVRRLQHHLWEAGCDVRVFTLDEPGGEPLADAVASFAPDCIHAFHGWLGGYPARELAMKLAVPYLITLTGTDVYGEAGTARSNEAAGILGGAAALTFFHDSIRDRLINQMPQLSSIISVIPQGVTIPEESAPEDGGTDEFVFLLPAGVRPVKHVLFPLPLLAQLQHSYPRLKFHLAGPILDPLYGVRVSETLARYPFARWLGEVPREEMPRLYRSSQVVLNTSRSEGGMANSIMEAMAHGLPVLASAVEGNRSLVTDGVTGLLYADEREFLTKAETLIIGKSLRRELGLNGRNYVREHCSPEKEARRYLDLYGRILANGNGAPGM